jgi:hypothetical protein
MQLELTSKLWPELNDNRRLGSPQPVIFGCADKANNGLTKDLEDKHTACHFRE